MQITRDDDFGGAVLNCAVRYALGRETYMPRLVMEEITPMLPDCSDKTLRVFERDISDWLLRDKGWTTYENSYAADWALFSEAVRTEIERRKGEQND